jgi:argininosuccinate lyase
MKDDIRLSEPVIDINIAHVIMLSEQKIITKSNGAALLEALLNLRNSTLDTSAEDVHMAVEEAVLKQTGTEVGGNLHIAKSRNDQVTTAVRMSLRRELISTMQLAAQLQETFCNSAKKHLNTIILEYTHLQPAQPVTYAHYLLYHIDALGRDLQRLAQTYARVNICPLGAGALATTSFPINRDLTAELLGFDSVLENSIDAVGSRDFITETMATLTLIELNLSRLAEDLIIWSSPDFGVIELPDDFTSTSSIMPQKKNPEILEVVRARASNVLGNFVATASTIKSLPSTYNLDFQEITPKLWEATEIVNHSLQILTQLVPNLKVSGDIAAKNNKSFAAATELANILVREYNIPFRSAHKAVGSLVKSLIETNLTFNDLTPELINKSIKDTLSTVINIHARDLAIIKDPIKLVEAYNVKGGPAPSEVKRAIVIREKQILRVKTDISKLAEKLKEAESRLEHTAKLCFTEKRKT